MGITGVPRSRAVSLGISDAGKTDASAGTTCSVTSKELLTQNAWLKRIRPGFATAMHSLEHALKDPDPETYRLCISQLFGRLVQSGNEKPLGNSC
jgi:hypothetical protein